MILHLFACLDYAVDLQGKDEPGFDSGDTAPVPVDSAEDSPPPEECNGVDDDGDGAVDEDFSDDDGDGVIDCLEHACAALDLGEAGPTSLLDACLGEPMTPTEPVEDPWSYVVEWGFSAPTTYYASVSTPIVGDLDGDGVAEIIIVGSGAFAYALDGATGDLKWELPDTFVYCTPVISDSDADGAPDLVIVDSDGFVVRYDGNGVELARSTEPTSAPYSLSVADLDADGMPEVIVANSIFEGDSLARRATWTERYAYWTFNAIGDVDRDGRQEIFRDGRLYDAEGTLLWDVAPTAGMVSYPALVQADEDDDAEFVLITERFRVFDTDGTLLAEGEPFPDYGGGTGLPTAGDFDGDGQMEVAFPVYYSGPFTMMELDGTVAWTIEGPSYRTYGSGAAGFDFDGDGALEIAYPGDEAFYVYDGATGATRMEYTDHESSTVLEFAVVADVDGDDHAEVVMVSPNAATWQVEVLGHAGEGWPAASNTWSQNDFSVVNVGHDGAVPAVPAASWLTNKVYRARTALDGSPALPDLTATVTDLCIADCAYGEVAVGVQVANRGAVDVTVDTRLVLYALDESGPRAVAEMTIGPVAAGTALDGVQFDLGVADIGALGFAAVIDVDDAVEECDETDNEGRWEDSYCP